MYFRTGCVALPIKLQKISFSKDFCLIIRKSGESVILFWQINGIGTVLGTALPAPKIIEVPDGL